VETKSERRPTLYRPLIIDGVLEYGYRHIPTTQLRIQKSSILIRLRQKKKAHTEKAKRIELRFCAEQVLIAVCTSTKPKHFFEMREFDPIGYSE